MTNSKWKSEIIVGACAIVLGSFAVAWCFPCPVVDDAFYKSPAAELAQHGRLAIPCSAGFLPRMEEVFACYPPLFQLVLAAWYLVWGVSLRSTIGFSFLVHALNSIAIVFVSNRLLARTCQFTSGSSDQNLCDTLSLFVGLIHLGNLAFLDRQEEFALLFVWSLVAGFDRVELLNWRFAMLAGLCVGCAALASPWVGVLAAFLVFTGICIRERFDRLSSFRHRLIHGAFVLSVAGGVSLALVAAWYFVLECLYPGVIGEQFFGILRHLKTTQVTKGVPDRLVSLLTSLGYSPGQMAATTFILVASCLVIKRGRVAPGTWLLVLTGLLGTLLLFATRPEAYTYFSPIQILTLPLFGVVVIATFSTGTHGQLQIGFLGKLFVTTCLLMPISDTAIQFIRAAQLPTNECSDQIFSRLQQQINPDQQVAVTARHWLAFQGRNQWREAFFSSLESPQEVVNCDWLVLTPDAGRPYFLDHFEFVEQVYPAADSRHSYAYVLYRKRATGRESRPSL